MFLSHTTIFLISLISSYVQTISNSMKHIVLKIFLYNHEYKSAKSLCITQDLKSLH